MAKTLADKLVDLAREHGWTDSFPARFMASPFDDKRRTRIDFVRGFDSVRLIFTKAGSVDTIWSRRGTFGDIREYEWQPGGAKTRRALAEELLSTGAIKTGNWSYL